MFDDNKKYRRGKLNSDPDVHEEIIDVEAYLNDRINFLGKKAEKERGFGDTAKTMGGGVLLVSFFCATAIPGSPIVIGASLAGYLVALYGDYSTTGRLRFLPSRRTFLSLKSEDEEKDFIDLTADFEEDVSYLPRKENVEARFINRYFEEISEKLSEMPVPIRAKTYKAIIDNVYSRKAQSKYYKYFEARSRQKDLAVETEIDQMKSVQDTSAVFTQALQPRKQIKTIEADLDLECQLFESDPQVSHHQKTEDFESPTSQPPIFVDKRKTQVTGYNTIAKKWQFCTFTIAGQGAGKSELYYWLSKYLAGQDVRVYYLNLASKKEDFGRDWEGHAQCVRCDLRKLDPKGAKGVISDVYQLIKNYDSCEEKKMLIIDEANVTFLKVHRYAKDLGEMRDYLAALIGDLVSAGGKGFESIHALGQGLKASTLSDGIFPLFKAMLLNYMTVAPGKEVYAADRNQMIGEDNTTRRDVVNNFGKDCANPPVGIEGGRILNYNGTWYPTGGKADLGFTDSDSTSEKDLSASRTSSTTAQKKRSQIEELIAELEEDGYDTLWSFAEAMGMPSSGAKRRLIEIISIYLESKRPDLASRFARDKKNQFSSFDGRYSYPDNNEKELKTRLLTNFCCCLCQKRSEDVEIHRTSYLGADDQPGENMFPLCEVCHNEAHEAGNWNSILDSIWSSHQTEGFTKRINLGLNFLTQNIDY
ncbi:hypothetical protein [Moorena sp. SIO3I8]|uniref:hypothetical protein n=1 Tax=Moorena sp. SIO3I8 TaxID=2607833 RepID=UPI0013C052B4|nr:hypothetical protein [Moorena sp. SIO3I8]NEO07802.1 hypothetical protein [Moorena sp. SIO3I8]